MKVRGLAVAAILVMLWVWTAAAADASDQAKSEGASAQAASGSTAAGQPMIESPELKYEFEPVVDGAHIDHDFIIRNTGNGDLAISQVKTG